MDINDFKEELFNILNPIQNYEGELNLEYPNYRLRTFHDLNFSYFKLNSMMCRTWEGSSSHTDTRQCPEGEQVIAALTRNQDVSERLFKSALILFSDSIIANHDKTDRKGEIRYYPPIILTFWSGFETFVRRLSELMLETVTEIPPTVENYLRERETVIDHNGNIKERTRFQPVLDRYAVLLLYGYGLKIDKGNNYWQNLVAANKLRDYYTHLDLKTPRAISSKEVLDFMENIMLAIIWPSSILHRTLFIGIYHLYDLWEILFRYAEDYHEQPFFKDFQLHTPYMFHCNFENIDSARFPNAEELHTLGKFKHK